MTNKVLLDNVDHHDLRALGQYGADYGGAVNQMLIFPTEFEEVQRDFPIFFRKDPNGEFQSVALLGLDRGENLFLSDDVWQSRYIPAVQLRGPLSINRPEQRAEAQSEPTIYIDLDDPRVGRSEGHPLFLPHGGNAPWLKRATQALRALQTGMEVSKPMFDAFEQAELLSAAAIEIQLDDNTQYKLPGYYTIDNERLARLDGASLERLHRGGFLRAAFWTLSSLGNVRWLIELKNRRRGSTGGPGTQ